MGLTLPGSSRAACIQAAAVAALVAQGWVVVAQDAEIPRVRSEDPSIASAIAEGSERSPSFRRLIESIGRTDGVVYVQEGRCGNSVRSCVHLSVIIAGPYRYLRILVSLSRAPGCQLVASIGHELQHALEVLSEPTIRSTADLFRFFDRNGRTVFGTFETDAAMEMGMRVEKEACR